MVDSRESQAGRILSPKMENKKDVKDKEKRAPICIPSEGHKITGNCSPKKKHLTLYLRDNPKHTVWTVRPRKTRTI